MSSDSRLDPGFDPRIRSWLAGDPDQAPVRLARAINHAVAEVPQRRLRLPAPRVGWRSMAMAAAVLAGLLGIAVAGSVLLDRQRAVVPVPLPANARPALAAGRLDAGPSIVFIDPDDGTVLESIRIPVDQAIPDIGPLRIDDVTWSPDYRRLAVAMPGALWVVDVAERRWSRIFRCSGEECGVDWSPDGHRLAVTDGGRLLTIDPSGGISNELLASGAIDAPDWSPDGTRIAFGTIDRAIRSLEVLVVEGADRRVVAGSLPAIGAWQPQWSGPDSLVFIGSTERACPNSAPGCEPWQLRVTAIPASGGEPQVVREVGACYCLGMIPALAVAPDGSQMAIVGPATEVGEPWRLSVMAADGGRLRPIGDAVAGLAWGYLLESSP